MVFALASFFHDLFTVIWMGGLIVTVIGFLPALKQSLGPGPQVKQVMMAFQKRQRVWAYVSMIGLIVTGLMMSRKSLEFERLFGFGNPYSVVLSIKHILVILMVGVTLYRTLVLGRVQAGMAPDKERLNLELLLVNAALAVAVLFTSGLVAALAGPLPG